MKATGRSRPNYVPTARSSTSKVEKPSKTDKSAKSKALSKQIETEKPSKRVPTKGLEVEDDDESDFDLDKELEEEYAHNELVQHSAEADGDEDEDEENVLEGFESETEADAAIVQKLPPVPTNRDKKLAKKARKAAASAATAAPSKPGTIYLGHIPHGFFEPQMHEYFSQFGTVTRLRLSRNRRTGKSKHYGWVEFASKEVAEIVAETMHGYLIHPHRLVCEVVEVNENVWKGANAVFKRIPWARINRERLEAKRTKGKWEELVRKDDERNMRRAEKIKELGIDYEPPMRGKKRKADEVPAKEVKRKKSKGDGEMKRVASTEKKSKVQK